jgi:hypothetical protein
MSRTDKGEPRGYAITQADLERYQQLERRLQQVSGQMGKARRSLMSRMGGPGRVEPGPLSLQVAYQDTGLTTTDEYGDETPVLARRLIVYSGTNPDDAA